MKPRRASGATDPPWMETKIKGAIKLKERKVSLLKEKTMVAAPSKCVERLFVRATTTRRELLPNFKTNLKRFFTYIR